MPSPGTMIAILIGTIIGCAIGWLIINKSPSEFQQGYEQGMHHAILYVRTTGEWPSYGWRHEHYNDDLQTEQDIWNTLTEGESWD